MPAMTAPIAPPPSPVLTTTPAPAVPDDIPDPAVPEAVLGALEPTGPVSPQWREHEALLHGFTAQIQRWMLDYHKQMMACVEATLEPVRQVLRQDASDNEHANYALADALLKMQEQGIRVQTVNASPYLVTVHAAAAEGYPMTFTVQKTSAAELVEGVTALIAWLKQAGYTGVQIQPSA